MSKATKKPARRKRSAQGAKELPPLSEKVLVFTSDGRHVERDVGSGSEVCLGKVANATAKTAPQQDGRRAITIEVDGKRSRIKEQFPLLASEYDESSLITEIANNNLALYRPIIKARIDAIRRRKKLSVNEVQGDAEVLALLKQRDAELRSLNAATIDALLSRKRQPNDCERLDAEIRAAVADMKEVTYETLADKLKKHSADALRLEMRRCNLSVKDYKKTNN